MQPVARTNFTTVTTEGAILPADLLQRTVAGASDLPACAPSIMPWPLASDCLQ